MRSDLFVRRRRGDLLGPLALVALAALLLLLVADLFDRPLWYNEQWRAWHLSLPDMPFRPHPRTNAPIAFGFAVLAKLSTAAFGDTAFALRLPGLVALPVLGVVTYRLARRWVNPIAALLAAGALLANRMVLTFATELAPYTVEAACTAGVVLLWVGARDEGRSPAGRWWRYGVIALLALVATPVAFVLGPLLLVDLARAVRDRDPASLAPSVVAGLVTLLHLVLYVGRQSAQTRGDYWADAFVPRDGGLLGAVWAGLASYVPRAVTSGTAHQPSRPDGEVVLDPGVRGALVVALLALLVAGVVAAVRDARVRPLAVALFGCLLAQVVASSARFWPYGFSRVNTFLLPLAYVLAAAGVVHVARALWPDRGHDMVVVAGVAAFALVAGVSWQQVATVRREAAQPAFGDDLGGLVDQVRERAVAGDVAVIVHSMAEKGFRYYMAHPLRAGGTPIAPERTLTLDGAAPDTGALRAFLDANSGARHVYLVAFRGTRPAAIGAVLSVSAERSYVETAVFRGHAGGIRELTR